MGRAGLWPWPDAKSNVVYRSLDGAAATRYRAVVSEALEGVRDPRRLRTRVGLAFVRILRPALYGLLVASALLTFWAGGSIGGRQLGMKEAQAAPILFGIFLIVFAVYRLALVRAKKYPAATGLFQIGLGALVWVLLLPGSRERLAAPPEAARDDVVVFLSSPQAQLRHLAAELAGYRNDPARYAGPLIEHLADPDPRVRETARASLVRMTGGDAAPGATGESAQEQWRAFARDRGWIR